MSDKYQVTSDGSGERRLRDRLQKHFDSKQDKMPEPKKQYGPDALPAGARYTRKTLRPRVQDRITAVKLRDGWHELPQHNCIADENVGCPACIAEGAPERVSWTLGGEY